MKHYFKAEIGGLNLDDQYILKKKFEVIKEKLYNNLKINSSWLKSYPNNIELLFEGSEEEVIDLYHLITNMKFNKSEGGVADDEIKFVCGVSTFDEDYGE